MQLQPQFEDPRRLIDVYQRDCPPGRPAARAYLRRIFTPLLLAGLHGLAPYARQRWAERALANQEMRLRATTLANIPRAWRDFIGKEAAHLTSLLVWLVPEFAENSAAPHAPVVSAQRQRHLHVNSWSRAVHDAGGDCLLVEVYPDGTVWVLLADATGHGRPAYLLGAGLPHLWQLPSFTAARSENQPPAAVLDLLHQELVPIVPSGEYVEAVLARISIGSSGDAVATIASAGACGILQRRSGAVGIVFANFPGCWLGVDWGVTLPRGQRDWQLVAGDELALASDGLLDHCIEEDRLRDRLAAMRISVEQTLFDILAQLMNCQTPQPQADDITFVSVRYLPGGDAA